MPVEVIAEQRHRLHQDIRTFERRELPKEGEAIPWTVLAVFREWFGGRPRTRDHAHLLTRDTPVHIPLANVLAGCHEKVDQREMRLDELLAHEEKLGRNLWKALVAASRRFLAT